MQKTALPKTLPLIPLYLMLVFSPDVAAWVYEKTGGVVGPHTAGFGWEKDGILTSGFAIEGWTKHNIYVHQRIEKPPNRTMWWSITNYCFNQLNVDRITALVPSSNTKALSLNKKIGFEYEGELKKAAHDGSNLIAMVMWKENCRMLSWRHEVKPEMMI